MNLPLFRERLVRLSRARLLIAALSHLNEVGMPDEVQTLEHYRSLGTALSGVVVNGTTGSGTVSPETGKFSIALVVSPPHNCSLNSGLSSGQVFARQA